MAEHLAHLAARLGGSHGCNMMRQMGRRRTRHAEAGRRLHEHGAKSAYGSRVAAFAEKSASPNFQGWKRIPRTCHRLPTLD